MRLHNGQRVVGGLPHSVLLQLIRCAAGANKRTLPANVDTPLEDCGCGWPDIGRITTGSEAGDAYGGDCSGRLCLFMVPDSGVFWYFFDYSSLLCTYIVMCVCTHKQQRQQQQVEVKE